MKILTVIEVMRRLAKLINKPCMYIDIYQMPNVQEGVADDGTLKAAPYLDCGHQVCFDGCGVLVFDTECEMWDYYKQTVGDDGPTSVNSYGGLHGVYALTCSANGELMNENT